jgi:hypothetical protein
MAMLANRALCSASRSGPPRGVRRQVNGRADPSPILTIRSSHLSPTADAASSASKKRKASMLSVAKEDDEDEDRSGSGGGFILPDLELAPVPPKKVFAKFRPFASPEKYQHLGGITDHLCVGLLRPSVLQRSPQADQPFFSSLPSSCPAHGRTMSYSAVSSKSCDCTLGSAALGELTLTTLFFPLLSVRASRRQPRATIMPGRRTAFGLACTNLASSPTSSPTRTTPACRPTTTSA